MKAYRWRRGITPLMLYAFFWVITRRLEFICRRFGTLCSIFIGYSHLPAYEDGTECSETSAYKLQTPGYYPKESIQHTEHGEAWNQELRSCLTSALDGDEWLTSCSSCFTPPGKSPGAHWIGGWLGPWAGLDVSYWTKIFVSIGIRTQQVKFA